MKIRKMLERGWDLDKSINDELHTPLCYAIETRRLSLVWTLLEAGAGIHATSGWGERTPLHYAVEDCVALPVPGLKPHEPKLDVIKTLLDRGADSNYGDIGDMSPLHLACIDCHPKVIPLLVQYGGDPNEFCGNDMRPLQVAASYGNPNILRALFENGAKIDTFEDDERRPIVEVMLLGKRFTWEQSMECIDVLIENGEDLNWNKWRETTPFMYSAALDQIPLARHLLKRNADVRYRNSYGESALALSVKREFPTRALVELCFAAGAAPPNPEFIEEYLYQFLDSYPVPDLKELCRKEIRSHLLNVTPPGNLFTYVPKLGLPQSLESYLLYDTSLEGPPNEQVDSGDEWWKTLLPK